MKTVLLVSFVVLATICHQSWAQGFFLPSELGEQKILQFVLPKIRQVTDYFINRCGGADDAKKLNEGVFTYIGCSLNTFNIYTLNENSTTKQFALDAHHEICNKTEEADKCFINLLETARPCFTEEEIVAFRDYESMTYDAYCNRELFVALRKLDKADDSEIEKCERQGRLLFESIDDIGEEVMEITTAEEAFNFVIKFIVDKTTCKLRSKVITILANEDLSECSSIKGVLDNVIKALENYCENNEIKH